MAQRASRKRGRRHPSVATPSTTATQPRPTQVASASPTASPRPSSEARNAAVRATLAPLAPGERPWPLKIAALIALLIGVSDLVVVLINGKFNVGGAHTAASGVILFSAVMIVCALGMWQLRYWAVLGFQAILVFVILFFSLLLTRAANLLAVAASVIVVGGSGYLFFKLVRVLSRLQMPKPPSR